MSASDFSLLDQDEKCEQFKLKIFSEYRTYCTMSKEFRDFLTRENLPQCTPILESLAQKDSKYYLFSDAIIAHINSRRETLSKSYENALKKSVAIQSSKRSVVKKSSVSRRSQSSKGSKASSKLSAAMALSRAKAEAAAAKLEYAELEAGLKKNEAQLLEEENFS